MRINMNKIRYSENELIRDIKKINHWIQKSGARHSSKSIYGVPRGGRYAATMLSMISGLPIIENPIPWETIIIDDIVDSGSTRKLFPSNIFISLHQKPNPESVASYCPNMNTASWVHYFWEDAYGGPGTDVVTRMIELIGDDPCRSGVKETPNRVLKSWAEMYSGYKKYPKEIMKSQFNEDIPPDGFIYLRDIEFFSTCEHHLLPFYGTAHVGYIPGKQGAVVGISKLARLVDCFSKRLQIQERIADQVTSSIMEHLPGCLGAICIIEAKHLCIACRGVGKQHSVMGCSSIKGIFHTDASARSEAISLLMKR